MSVSLVARRYAQALLELGAEQGDLDRVVEEIGAAAQAWVSSAELRNVVENPLVPYAAKKAVVSELAERLGASATARHALLLLVDRRRTRTLPYVAQFLRELADARRGLVRAQVTTAAPLSDAYYARLQAQLERMTARKVVIDRVVDESIIGGVVTRIGDRIIDGSLRTRLQSLKDAMMPPA